MHGFETTKRINAEVQAPKLLNELRLHPRIVALTRAVNALPVDKEYRRWLRHSLWLYADQIIERIEPSYDEGWDDLEALQQAALGDWNEAMLHAMCNRYN